MTTGVAEAPAKINLALRVLGLRDDGFHEIDSLIAPISLFDRLEAQESPDGELTLTCNDRAIPTDRSNLILRAAEALRTVTGFGGGVRLHLTKRIPAGAGLGGGSSDAAAALRLLNALWRLDLPDDRLDYIGASIGSDVPVFLRGGFCRVRGRGEIVDSLAQKIDAWAVLILPNVHCATPAVYRCWDELHPDGMNPPKNGREIDAILARPRIGTAEMPLLFNDLEPAMRLANPGCAELIARIRTSSRLLVCMSGSGSAFFTLEHSAGGARRVAQEISRAAGIETRVVQFLARDAKA